MTLPPWPSSFDWPTRSFRPSRGGPHFRVGSPSSHGLGPAPESDPNEPAPLSALAYSPEVLRPFSVCWLRVATCAGLDLTRLRCVFRLSQPPDAFFHPKPFQPSFMLVTLMGFPLQRFPLPRAGCASRRPFPSWLSRWCLLPSPRLATRMCGIVPRAFPLARLPSAFPNSGSRLPSGTSATVEVRSSGPRPFGPVAGAVPLLGFNPPGFSPRRSRHGHCHVSSPALRSRDASSPFPVLQSFNERRVGWSLSRLPTLLGFLSSSP